MVRPHRLAPVRMLLAALSAGLLCTTLGAQDPSSAAVDFFEEKVRPLLATRCYKCHGPDKQESNLRLDHISFLLKGGERGPALQPGKPEASRILSAVGYQDEDLKMPPKGRLLAGDIATLRQWVAAGAAWPNEPVPTAAPKKPTFDLRKRHQAHWSWRALQEPPQPDVTDPTWNQQAIDRFVFRRMLDQGLQPADPADRATLLRRVTFDLTGMPPSIAAQDEFLADDSPNAYTALVERLLASKHFGEHWARHWLDLARYAESLGHEFDYKIPNAYRYRDYVIRAFNADLPYDQFVREQIAGDLIQPPRLDKDGHNESAIGTGLYWLVEQTHAPVDVRQHQSDRRDNQIDVLTKTFLGLTVGCARCHDHKFDAISTADYYALSGFLKSSRFAQIDSSPPTGANDINEFAGANRAFRAAWLKQLHGIDSGIAKPLRVAVGIPLPPPTKKKGETSKTSADLIGRWVQALAEVAVGRDRLHPLHGFHLLKKQPGLDLRKYWQPTGASLAQFEKTGAVPLADFRTDDYSKWFVQGKAFGTGPTRAPIFLRRQDGKALAQSKGWAFSATQGLHAQGVLRSQTFEIQKRYLHFFGFGMEARVRLVLEGFNIIRAPIYGQLHQLINNETPRWYTIDLSMWKGRQGYLAFVDQQPAALGEPSRGGGYKANGYLAVQQVWFSDSRTVPEARRNYPSWLLGKGPDPINSPELLIQRFAQAVEHAQQSLLDGTLEHHHAHLLNLLWDKKLLGDESKELQALRAALEKVENKIGVSRHSPGMVDGTGEDEHIYLRGRHNHLGPLVPRRILEALGGKQQQSLRRQDGSGRLHLAERILAPENPYPARVIVNRLWHHLFGRGIVRTVDNFGVLGEKPSHPQLLDWLAAGFIADGWSIKRAIRRIVLSRTYQQSSNASESALRKDPSNVFLSHASVRRITSESIRDSILTTSGRLDTKMFGPSVPVHIDKFTEGRGRPGQGPVDGNGRRSIYLQVTRNFLSSFLLAFDMPRPVQTMGLRDVTNVPSQALAMLNDPFVLAEAKRWAKHVTTTKGSKARIRRIYREGLARVPGADEIQMVETFLRQQCKIYRCKISDPRPWEDLCHSIFNVKEFILLR
ncbi:MAG: PSD1 and planctomycete cytochrome C domain-containing protein [Planctomycetota bacterium]|nr:PSD1 and planctomycete cytochrome C domain-containing protein [Planctomycetota bacterium]